MFQVLAALVQVGLLIGLFTEKIIFPGLEQQTQVIRPQQRLSVSQ